jgi:hypothetical protein
MKPDLIKGAKEEISESLPTLMWFAVALGLLASLTSCEPETAVCPVDPSCDTKVTLRDLNLDGCNWALELEDGSKLIPLPEGIFEPNGTAQTWKVDGKKLMISYKPEPVPNICMAGQTVIVTCITEITSPVN